MDRPNLLKKVTALQDGLIDYATGKAFKDTEYKELRRELLANTWSKQRLPKFVREIRSLDQFWPLITKVSANYAGRRQFIWQQFQPLETSSNRTS
jgi:hypothetical protein